MDTLECLFCKKQYPLDVFSPFCPDCREPMTFARPEGKRHIRREAKTILEQFSDFLPFKESDFSLSLGEGNTPLVELKRLGHDLGRPHLFVKNEAQNPTHSFKDRGTAAAVRKAVALGFQRIGTVSTGNMAASTAAYGAGAGLETIVLLKEETPLSSLLAAGIYGPRLIRVRGDYGRLFYRSLEIGRRLGIYFMNSVDPVRIEGYKMTAYEIFLGLGNKVPDFIFVPLSSGGHLIGLMRGFEDLLTEGLVGSFPTFVGVQAEGCAPLARAFEAGSPRFVRIENPHTIAHAISNPDPPGGNVVLRMLSDHGGIILSVSDDDMILAQRRLAASEGLFGQPESATTLAGLEKIIAMNQLGTNTTIVLILTGSGLKSSKALECKPVPVEDADLDCLEKNIESGLFHS